MGQDTFTEVTQQSWGGRLGGSIKGILVGLVFFIVAFPLLFWNEGRAVKRHKTLQEGGGAVVSVASDKVDQANEGSLIHTSGTAVTDEMLADDDFGIAARALKLRRIVLMYQWKENRQSETKKKLGGGTETVTTYRYEKTWAPDLISSAEFKKAEGHLNPSAMPFRSREKAAGSVVLGAFVLPPSLAGRINDYRPLSVNAGAEVPAALGEKAGIGAAVFTSMRIPRLRRWVT